RMAPTRAAAYADHGRASSSADECAGADGRGHGANRAALCAADGGRGADRAPTRSGGRSPGGSNEARAACRSSGEEAGARGGGTKRRVAAWGGGPEVAAPDRRPGAGGFGPAARAPARNRLTGVGEGAGADGGSVGWASRGPPDNARPRRQKRLLHSTPAAGK